MNEIIELLTKELNLDLETDKVEVKTFADGNTSDVIELLKNDEEYVCKYMKHNNETIRLLFENEIYFYTHFYKNLFFINIPQVYHCYNDDDTKFIVLKKINNDECDINNITIIKNVCTEILKLHIYFFENTHLLEMDYPSNSQSIIEKNIKKDAEMYFYVLKNYVPDDIYEKLTYLLDHIDYHLYSSTRVTIIHGALKRNNICFEKNNYKMIPYFIDWSLIRKGYGVEDILYLLIFSLKHSFFKECYLEILDYYYDEMNKCFYYEINDFEKDILISLKGFIVNSVLGLFFMFHFTKKENHCFEALHNYLLILDYYENKIEKNENENKNENKKEIVSYDLTEKLDILDAFENVFLWYLFYFACGTFIFFPFLCFLFI